MKAEQAPRSRPGTILVCDDEVLFRRIAARALREHGHTVHEVGTVAEARRTLAGVAPDLLLLDLHLPDGDGLDVLADMTTLAPHCLVAIVTAHAGFESAVEALRLGAYDYVAKPLQLDDLAHRCDRLLEVSAIRRENAVLRRLQVRRIRPAAGSRSATMERIYEQARRFAERGRVCLITGESGTGKEVLARHIHTCCSRDGPFVPVNLAAMPESVAESQLFGHMRGAFTGADRAMEGLARAAANGTLFLDEISEAPVTLQAKLLRLVDRGEVLPVGSTTPMRVQMQIVAATNRDLPAEVRRGRFREDLLHRLNVIHLRIPPLRERSDEIPTLCEQLLGELAAGRDVAPSLSPEALAALCGYPWPGNVRELRNVLERALILGSGIYIEARDLPPEIAPAADPYGETTSGSTAGDLRAALARFERTYIRAAIEEAGGDRRAAAGRLGIGLATLYRKLPPGE